METLSSIVKRLRKQNGLTQEDLARKAGVSIGFVRELEQGKQSLRMDVVNRLLELFDYSLQAKPNER